MPIRSSTPPSVSRRRSGVSLLEAVVAIAIVGMTAVSALESAGAGMRAAAKSQRAIEAAALATSRLEFMDFMSDRQLESLPDSVQSGKWAAPLDEYSWKTTAAPLNDQAGVFDVRITVAWANGSYTLKTYVYRQPQLLSRR